MPGALLDRRDVVRDPVKRLGQQAVDGRGIVARDEIWLVAVPDEQRSQLLLGNPREDRRVGDLVAIQVEDRDDSAVGPGRKPAEAWASFRELPLSREELRAIAANIAPYLR